ncbi:hypothetical protein OG1X_0504 [Enterococcus faecalis OG1X]|nr:hypothetical protein OG1X_0504 [Enterococcus faecalis OG1X]
MIAVSPPCTARSATFSPTGPPPNTIRSYSSVFSAAFMRRTSP